MPDTPSAPPRRIEHLSSARLFLGDSIIALGLLNEARHRTIQGVFGVRRDQVNLMTAIAALTLAEAAHQKTERLRSGLRVPTRGDVILADGLLNALGRGIAGPYARETPFFTALIGAAAVGAVAARVLQHSSRDIKAASHRIKRSFKEFLIPGSTPST